MDQDQSYFIGLNHIRDDVHTLAINKGWYDNEETEGQFITRSVANMHGEISELWEAHRNKCLDQPCDKAEKMNESGYDALTCEEEELADLIIRALDHAGRRKINIARAVKLKHDFNASRAHRHGGKAA